jgi:hypothetical protein
MKSAKILGDVYKSSHYFFCVCLQDQREERNIIINNKHLLDLPVSKKKRSLLSQAPPNPKESNYEKSFNDKLHRRVNGMPAYKSHNIYTPVE